MLVNPGIQSAQLPLKFSCRVLLAGSALAFCLLSASCNRSAIPDTTAVFGKVVTAAGVDSSNSPTALADVFSPQQKTVYVVAEAKHVAAGTHLTANWSREGTVIQVSNEVVAAQEYRDANIEFHMNPGADGWIPGTYKVQIIANGQPGPGTGFTIK